MTHDVPFVEQNPRPSTLQQLLEYNSVLTSLSQAGLPICLRVGRYGPAFQRDLELATNVVARRLGLAEPLAGHHADCPEVPAEYVAAFQAWVAGHPAELAYGALVREPLHSRRRLLALQNAFVQLAVLFVLAYLCLIILCSYTTPQLESLVIVMGRENPGPLAVFSHLHRWMPVWVPLVPALVLVLGLLVMRKRWQGRRGDATRRLDRWLSPVGMMSRMIRRSRSSHHDTPDSLAAKESTAGHAARLIGLGKSPEQAVSEAANLHRLDLSKIPALIRWAVAPVDDVDRSQRRLRLVQELYQRLGTVEDRRRCWQPLLFPIVTGGAVVALIAIGFFAAYASTLTTITLPR